MVAAHLEDAPDGGRSSRKGRGRSLAKAVSWRIVGTVDTIALSYFFLGNIGSALAIGALEVFTKIGLFYGHDRIWEHLSFGRRPDGTEAHWRSMVKTISWRGFASLDTFLLSWAVTSKPVASASIALAEAVTKTILYYMHERAWLTYGKRA